MRSLAALALFGIAVMFVAYGTFAVFQDVETSEGNYIQAGTLDIHLTDHPDPNYQWLWLYMFPGDTDYQPGKDGQIAIYNDGTLQGDHIEIAFNFTCYEDDDGDIFVNLWGEDFTYNSSKHHVGPESDNDKKGIGTWLQEVTVDVEYQHWPKFIKLCEGCTLEYLSETVFKVNDVPQNDGSDYALLDITIKGVENKNGTQNGWQGDVCEMIIHVALAQDANQTVLSPGGVTVYCPGSGGPEPCK